MFKSAGHGTPATMRIVVGPVRISGVPTGSEPFRRSTEPMGLTLLDFWRWSESDLLNSQTRSRLAEFIVATALGARAEGPRDERSALELVTPDDVEVRVKSGSFLKSFRQQDLSKVVFIPQVRPRPGASLGAARRPLVHVFALLDSVERASVDPLDLGQWRFFVPPTSKLEALTKEQHALTVPRLDELSMGSVAFEDLEVAVRRAAEP
ncbi:MAG: hypothetical protein PT977_08010 [Acidobacteriota bacterium]|nr:hypothetical protein [Acidobacteriota bacterium]